jgi:hypothetical protein
MRACPTHRMHVSSSLSSGPTGAVQQIDARSGRTVPTGPGLAASELARRRNPRVHIWSPGRVRVASNKRHTRQKQHNRDKCSDCFHVSLRPLLLNITPLLVNGFATTIRLPGDCSTNSFATGIMVQPRVVDSWQDQLTRGKGCLLWAAPPASLHVVDVGHGSSGWSRVSVAPTVSQTRGPARPARASVRGSPAGVPRR